MTQSQPANDRVSRPRTPQHSFGNLPRHAATSTRVAFILPEMLIGRICSSGLLVKRTSSTFRALLSISVHISYRFFTLLCEVVFSGFSFVSRQARKARKLWERVKSFTGRCCFLSLRHPILHFPPAFFNDILISDVFYSSFYFFFMSDNLRTIFFTCYAIRLRF